MFDYEKSLRKTVIDISKEVEYNMLKDKQKQEKMHREFAKARKPIPKRKFIQSKSPKV